MARFGKFDSRGRLARVLAVVRGEPTGARPTSQVRIKLGALPAPLRAVVRDESNGGMLIEAELPWLTVGSEIQAEMPDGREKAGRVHWFGVDATSAGSARLRIFVDLSASNEGVPVKLPDIAEFAESRPRPRWPWAVATILLMSATGLGAWVMARRTVVALVPPPSVTVQQPVPPAPAPVTPAKVAPVETPPAPAPSVTPAPAKATAPAKKPKRKRR